jgi:predicted XRE-type DNA-binding protein
MTPRVRVTRGSGNVFADLGLPDPEARLAKAELAARINTVLEQRELTQALAAEVLGIDQPSVSKLARGKLRGFSVERLIGFLRALSHDVEIRVSAAPRRRLGHLAVQSTV